MSVSHYTYVGPIIRIKNEISIDSISAICSNAQCVNHKQDNSIADGDAFCSKCGSKVETHTFRKSIGKDFHEILAQDEEFEDDFFDLLDVLPNAESFAVFSGGKDYAQFRSSSNTNIFIIDEKSSKVMMEKFHSDEDVRNFLNMLDVKYGLNNFEIQFGFTTYSN